MADGKGHAYHLAIALSLGQLVSLLITATGLASSIVAREGIDAPTSQTFCNYVLVGVFYGCLFLGRGEKLQMPWYYYCLLAFIDVEANYAVVKAYQYTSLTSVMLLDCCTIPCVFLLTWLFLKTKYNAGQFFGAGICVVGLVLVILSDVHSKDRVEGSVPILGDMLVILGSILYAVTNVSEEFLVKKVDFIELMAFLGSFGALISACQLIILERHELKSIHWAASSVLPFITYALSLFFFYTLAPLLLKISGSAMLNLSLLTSDMWAAAIRVFLYHQKVDWLYFIAFGAVAIGLVIYSTCDDDNGESVCFKHLQNDDLHRDAYLLVASTDIEDGGKQESEETLASEICNAKDANSSIH